MGVLKYVVILLILAGSMFAQVPPPAQIPASVVKTDARLNKNGDKKVFILYNLSTEALAEAMYTGTKFLSGDNHITYIPVFVNGITDQKTTLSFDHSLPVQNIRTIGNSAYIGFGVEEASLPVLIAYNENNELCGTSHTVEELVKIDCINSSVAEGKYLRLKVLTEDKHKKELPYANKNIYVLNSTKTETLSVLTTNAYGDFEYRVPDENQDYVLNIPGKMDNVNFVILATQSGRQISKFVKTSDGFEYRLLKPEYSKLPDLSLSGEEDVDVKLNRLDKAKTKDYTITENLFYELGKSELLPSSKDLLDKIITVLKMKPNFKLVIISHTDSQGDDAANLKLSEARSNAVIDYFVSKGVDRNILTGIGKGESEIRNRCTNGVECSDKEHEYNRRTEFKFIKS